MKYKEIKSLNKDELRKKLSRLNQDVFDAKMKLSMQRADRSSDSQTFKKRPGESSNSPSPAASSREKNNDTEKKIKTRIYRSSGESPDEDHLCSGLPLSKGKEIRQVCSKTRRL